MKRVYYLRHAKSSWDDLVKNDIDRVLNARGRRDAPVMASKLKEYLDGQNIRIGKILCSTSERTKETILHFGEKAFAEIPIVYDPKLYHASSEYLIECLAQVEDDIDNVIVCSHNPGISYLSFDIGIPTNNIPTCGIYESKHNVDSWLDVSKSNSKGGIYIYPKKFRDENS